MNVTAGKTSSKKLRSKAVEGAIEVPFRAAEGPETLALGLRQSMIEVEGKGGVSTGAGLGTDFVILTWEGRTVYVRGSDLLRAWLAMWCPEDAARLQEG